MYSDPNTMASALFAKASSAGMDYIQGNIQRYVAHVPQMHQHMQQRVVKMWDNFKDSQIGRKAEAIRHKLNNFWKDVYSLPTDHWGCTAVAYGNGAMEHGEPICA